MSHLSEPLALPCGAVLENRLAKSAMSEALGDPDGRATPELERLYRRWSEGGAGLLITGNVMVDGDALGEPGNVVFDDRLGADHLRAWAAAATANGNHAWVQINHPGRQQPRITPGQPVAPSAVPLEMAGGFRTPRALETEEVWGVVRRFARAAWLAKEAGFTGVQIHGAHGYLVSQFLSPKTNLRDDIWGGDAERRGRFLIEIVRAARAEVGPGFPIGVKLNSADFQRGGFSEAESMEVVRRLEAEGVDLLEISGGTYERSAFDGSVHSDSTREREAYFLGYAETVRGTVRRMPLMLTGGFRSGGAMQAAIGSGAVDVVGLARPMAVEPALPARVLADASAIARTVRLRTGSKQLDALLEIAWYGEQIRRMGRGRAPRPQLSRARALAAYMWHGMRRQRRCAPRLNATPSPA